MPPRQQQAVRPQSKQASKEEESEDESSEGEQLEKSQATQSTRESNESRRKITRKYRDLIEQANGEPDHFVTSV
jgi:hypothetical protein